MQYKRRRRHRRHHLNKTTKFETEILVLTHQQTNDQEADCRAQQLTGDVPKW